MRKIRHAKLLCYAKDTTTSREEYYPVLQCQRRKVV